MEMKTLLEQLHHWRCKFLKKGEDPKFIPMTRDEFQIISTDFGSYTQTERFRSTCEPCVAAVIGQKLFGYDVFDSPFAIEMRARQIDVPLTRIAESTDVSYYHEYVTSNDPDKCRIKRRLIATLCHDTTNITLTFEWDCFTKFKRTLRITKWFPIKTRTATIEGRVLYPYLKVSLPHNKHHVQFKHTK